MMGTYQPSMGTYYQPSGSVGAWLRSVSIPNNVAYENTYGSRNSHKLFSPSTTAHPSATIGGVA